MGKRRVQAISRQQQTESKTTMKTNTTVARGKAPGYFCIAALAFALGTSLATAIPVSLISGTSGSFMAGQSYNETRAIDVTMLSPVSLLVESMTLTGVNGSGPAEAVIYDSNTHLLIASAMGTVTGGTVTVPISATLLSGGDYRIGFFGDLGTATVFLPGSFPYADSSGLFQIDGASESPTDSFPSNWNLADPQVSLEVTPVPERAGSMALLGFGMLGVLTFRRSLQKRINSCAQT